MRITFADARKGVRELDLTDAEVERLGGPLGKSWQVAPANGGYSAASEGVDLVDEVADGSDEKCSARLGKPMLYRLSYVRVASILAQGCERSACARPSPS